MMQNYFSPECQKVIVFDKTIQFETVQIASKKLKDFPSKNVCFKTYLQGVRDDF